METKDDLAIIQRIQSGEREAYAELVRKYQSRLIRLCRSMLGPAEAEDAAQEAFFKAYQALNQFKKDASFYTWLYRIASNHCLGVLRARASRPQESLDIILEEEKEGLIQLLSSQDPRQVIDARALVDRILATLKPSYRLVIILRERDGLSYEEIAQITHSSVDSVKAMLQRARAQIEEKLRHFLPKESV